MTLYSQGNLPIQLITNFDYIVGRYGDDYIQFDDESVMQDHALFNLRPTGEIFIAALQGKVFVNDVEVDTYEVTDTPVVVRFGNVVTRLAPGFNHGESTK